MTYFGFLALFLGIPITLLLLLTWVDERRGRRIPAHFSNYAAWMALAVHVIIALVYTTPWDNYLVATRVWWYDPNLVTGFTIGWVPIEEYTFFVVQPIFTGLFLLWLMRHLPVNDDAGWQNRALCRQATWVATAVWVIMVVVLLSDWQPGTYLALELGWALIPIILQLGFGADILWQHRRLVALALIPTTLYLAAADALAIQSGTWTIDPEQSLNWLIGGVLPIEEFIFFLLTNVLIVFGMTLALAKESRARLDWFMALWQQRQQSSNAASSR